ncbi:MAG: hypothetical protein RIQ93_2727 [Verrucomicrobiota bacterium]|jgi:predicted nuclease with RNAse H fold
MSPSSTGRLEPIMAGIDVGGPAKGFHGVALRGCGVIARFNSREALQMTDWCHSLSVTVVAIDAPCRWRSPGRARAAERELARDKISCFSTPTEEKARGHAFYTWMFAGQELYRALEPHYPICTDPTQRGRVALETFPQAVACALAGQIVSARQKKPVRRDLLRRAGIDPSGLRNIDEIDATLCAVAAQAYFAGQFKAYGDVEGGYIIVPKSPHPRAKVLSLLPTP